MVSGLHENRRVFGLSAAVLIGVGFLGLTGCGGGGGSNPVVTASPSPSASVAPSPSPSATPSPSPSASPANAPRLLPLETGDLVYNPRTGQIIASLPSAAGANGNSICSIDPQTLAVSKIAFVGSEPGKLALSDNNVDLYVALDGSAAVRRVNVETGAVGTPFALGSGYFGPYYAEDLAVMPGNANVLAVSRTQPGLSPGFGGVAIFDDGVMRPTTTSEQNIANRIEWGMGSRIYGYDNEVSDFAFRRMEVSDAGVTVVDTANGVITGYGVDITYSAGRIYATTGAIVDAEAKTLAGRFGISGLICVDAALKRVWVLTPPLTNGNNYTLTAYDPDTFLEIDSQTFSGVTGTPTSLIRWGATGLAFRTSNTLPVGPSGGQVVIISAAPGL